MELFALKERGFINCYSDLSTLNELCIFNEMRL